MAQNAGGHQESNKQLKTLPLGRAAIDRRVDINAAPLRLVLLISLLHLLLFKCNHCQAQNVLMRVCDAREIKAVTSRVCMLYKRTRNSILKVDKHGNLRLTRGTKNEWTPARLASECCKNGCHPHIFAYNC